jgi:hypothetical protein
MCGAELSARINTAVRAARPFAVEQCARAWCNRIRVRITWSTAPDLPSYSIALPLDVDSLSGHAPDLVVGQLDASALPKMRSMTGRMGQR